MPRVYDMSDPIARAEGIAAAADAVRRGELVAMPTETVYGLAADAGNPQAIGAIFLAKGRPRFNPLIVHVASFEAARQLAAMTDDAERLAQAFWPGPLSLVVPRRGTAVADLATAGLDTVAVRVPGHPVAAALLAACGCPLAAPSANRSGHVSPTTAAHVIADLGEAVSVVLDAGAAPIGLESTIVGLGGGEATLLRPGPITRANVEAVLGRRLARPMVDPRAPPAPGMTQAHYAPTATLRLNASEVRAGEGLLAFGPRLPRNSEQAVAVVNLSPAGDTAEAASGFFAALRRLDEQVAAIAAAPIPEEGLGEAINDRLRRAAAPRS